MNGVFLEVTSGVNKFPIVCWIWSVCHFLYWALPVCNIQGELTPEANLTPGLLISVGCEIFGAQRFGFGNMAITGYCPKSHGHIAICISGVLKLILCSANICWNITSIYFNFHRYVNGHLRVVWILPAYTLRPIYGLETNGPAILKVVRRMWPVQISPFIFTTPKKRRTRRWRRTGPVYIRLKGPLHIKSCELYHPSIHQPSIK